MGTPTQPRAQQDVSVTMLKLMPSRVLIVDDDRDTRLLLDSLLSSDGHTCELASDAASAMAFVDSRRPSQATHHGRCGA
jgi:PleD family two-component response regulator